jgi:hypothetical protein
MTNLTKEIKGRVKSLIAWVAEKRKASLCLLYDFAIASRAGSIAIGTWLDDCLALVNETTAARVVQSLTSAQGTMIHLIRRPA